MKKIITVLCFGLFVITSCNNGPTEAEQAAAIKRKNDSMMQAVKSKQMDISKIAFGSNEDPTCGMPIRAGVTDTATVNGKLYGFCAKECKEAFLKTKVEEKKH